MVEELKNVVKYIFQNSILSIKSGMKKISEMMTEFVLYNLRKEP